MSQTQRPPLEDWMERFVQDGGAVLQSPGSHQWGDCWIFEVTCYEDSEEYYYDSTNQEWERLT